MIGIKLRFIAKNCVFIVINLSNIIKLASNNADNIIFFVFEIVNLVIKKLPSFWHISAQKERVI